MIDWFEARSRAGAVLPTDPLQAFVLPAARGLRRRVAVAAGAALSLELPRATRACSATASPPRCCATCRCRTALRAASSAAASTGSTSPATASRARDARARRGRLHRDAGAARGDPRARSRSCSASRPCLADFGFFASMFRHFSLDPTPARLMRDTRAGGLRVGGAAVERAPRRVAGDWPAPGTLPAGWARAAARRRRGLPAVSARQRRRLARRARRFDCDVQGAPYRALPDGALPRLVPRAPAGPLRGAAGRGAAGGARAARDARLLGAAVARRPHRLAPARSRPAARARRPSRSRRDWNGLDAAARRGIRADR